MKTIKEKKAQAFVEFLLIFPILFLIFLFAFQMIVIISKQQQTQMSVWLGLRSHSLRTLVPGGVGFKSTYSKAQVETMVRKAVAGNSTSDNVSVSIKESSKTVYENILLKQVQVEIKNSFPYLFKGLSWEPVRKMFGEWLSGDSVVVKAKGSIEETRTW
ncbi:MAG: pilus assembly protein [Candidatus Orphnella occulta]|nr:pilus assembly protein [Candidatus Orphnella occulta]